MSVRDLFAAVGAVAFVACGPVDAPPPSGVTGNTCPEHACSAYSQAEPPACSAGVCAVTKIADFVFVVAVPEDSNFAPGLSFTLTTQDFFDATKRCTTVTTSAAERCLRLPNFANVLGEYTANTDIVSAAGRSLDHDGKTSLPVHLSFVPSWQPPNASSPVDASLVGLPLPPVLARLTLDANPYPSPVGNAPIGWDAILAPGAYTRVIALDAPFDDAFPPDVQAITAGVANGEVPLLAIDKHVATVTRDSGDLEGWTIYLRTSTPQRRVSTTVTLHGGGGQVELHTFGGQSLEGLELVVAPPPASALIQSLTPSFVQKTVAATLPPPFKYPALPQPVIVRGDVTSPAPENAPVSARITLRSKKILTVDPTDKSEAFLVFEEVILTDDLLRPDGVNGQYQATLPPGTYDAVIEPSLDSGLAKSIAQLDVAAGDPSQPQAGKNFTALRPAMLTGTCTVADGRPLVGAEVVLTAATILLTTPTTDPPAHWPRATRTRTDAAGAFSVPVDFGTFDVAVRPLAGTHLPWTVSATHVVPPPQPDASPKPVDVGALVTPAPAVLSFTLHAQSPESPVLRALVRAYAFSGGVAHEVGLALTDASGHGEMNLPPPAQGP